MGEGATGITCHEEKVHQIAAIDYNNDGVEDKFYATAYYNDRNERVGGISYYVEISAAGGQYVKMLGRESSPVTVRFEFRKESGKLAFSRRNSSVMFRKGDLASTEYGQGLRINEFVMDLDKITGATIHSGAYALSEEVQSTGNYFSINELRLVLPAGELDNVVDELFGRLSRDGNVKKILARRGEILEYAELDCLKPKYKKELKNLDRRLMAKVENFLDSRHLDKQVGYHVLQGIYERFAEAASG